jgi:putative addiction module killer protein
MLYVNTIHISSDLQDWLDSLRDARAQTRIALRIAAARWGNFGDVKPTREGISEMRIDVGQGYRVYFTRRGPTVYFLLCGGNKSTQERDIKTAIKMARELK